MYLILTASKDTYITNKIINNAYRTTDANLGRAGTLDLFKLYDESVISGSSNPIELSRVLIKFELDTLHSLTGTTLDIRDTSFKCTLKMKDVLGTQAVPRNFSLIAYPLSQSFDEGDGRDVKSFGDLDVANFVTASYSGGINYPWFVTGANKVGLLGSDDIDVIGSGSLGSGVVQLGKTQIFDDGTEDLSIDVTQIVSATLVGLVPNHGYRLSFTSSEEIDSKTRFVKRFGSRHSRNVYLRPTMHVVYDDTIQDNHANFLFDVSGSLFLNNYHRGVPSNIVSGTSLTPLSGEDSISLTLRTGSFSKTVQASQFTGSTTDAGLPGLYLTSLAIPSADTTIVIASSSIRDFAIKSGSLTFDEIWHSNDGTMGFYTGSITLTTPQRTAVSSISALPVINVTNLNGTYRLSDTVKIRVFGLDTRNAQNTPAKLPINIKSEIFDAVYYQVVDTDVGDIVIPFTKEGNATRCSTDLDGMFFNFSMSALHPGRVYHFEFLVVDRGIELLLPERSPAFRVDAS